MGLKNKKGKSILKDIIKEIKHHKKVIDFFKKKFMEHNYGTENKD